MDGSTGVGGERAEGHHASRWALVAALGAGGLYAGAGLDLVGPDLVPPLVPLALGVGGGLALVVGLAGWVDEASLGGSLPGAGVPAGLYTGGTVLFLLSDVAVLYVGATMG